jgi:hypothetical protein
MPLVALWSDTLMTMPTSAPAQATGQQQRSLVSNAMGVQSTQPLQAHMAGNINNPFLISATSLGAPQGSLVGVNRPLYKPMFMGYWDDKPQYGGSRLFVLA